MKVAIICSKKDQVGHTFYNSLRDRIKPKMGEHEVGLHYLDEETIFMAHIDKKIPCDLMIFCAPHETKSGIDALTVHVQGNLDKPVMGGEEKTICTAPTAWMKQAFKLLNEKAKDYEVILEATHHGPQVTVPTFFLEIGSSPKMWGSKEAGDLMADVIVELLEKKIPDCKSIVAIGGLHHGPQFKKIMLNSEYGVGHLIPKYNLEFLDEKMLLETMDKSEPKAETVILDWKGLGEHKARIRELLEENKIDWKRTKEF